MVEEIAQISEPLAAQDNENQDPNSLAKTCKRLVSNLHCMLAILAYLGRARKFQT